ncbi:MAG: carbamoyltransferase HypF [Chloroflexi bacterium]|nr:carbamoyltransferase HypF [Chloroflexota bacterium]
MAKLSGNRIHITGIVQGVGFRPFVYGLATDLNLTGWVRNSSAGVDIEVDGRPEQLQAFVHGLTHQLPPLAQIDAIDVWERPSNGFTSFTIVTSESIDNAFQPISPDVSICPDCLHEMFNPQDRRYLYPFTNCTNCGPRFTIIKDIPYDRPATTMAPFEMCTACAAEYHNPRDRRFHAQPVACAVCGPHVWIERSHQSSVISYQSKESQAIVAAQAMLANGRILAIKGLGGFHLACDATNETAVSTLRERKLRREKPFAVMMADLETVQKHCFVSDAEADLLTSRKRPIVVLERQPDSPISTLCTPGQNSLGVMLPYTPFHYLLFWKENNQQSTHRQALGKQVNNQQITGKPLVMTSGNLSEEPIAYTNEDARERLSDIADAFLMHNREIHVRCDDSVMRILDLRLTIDDSNPNRQSSIVNRQSIMPLRRSRGYAPFPVKLPWELPPILGAGAELKNTFCVSNGRYAFLSHHIGDLENYETLQSFEEGVAHFEKLFRVRSELIAYDKHPNYLATRYAQDRGEQDGIPTIAVQHHHAHIAACMAEHGLTGDEPVIGLAFDGTGYGDDGTIWGGELLVADYVGYERPYHLRPVPLPGGDKAIREPWRMALSWLHEANIPWEPDLPPLIHHLPFTIHHSPLNVLKHQLTNNINAPLTSSMGRLFDAVAALVGIRQTVNYEAQAAIELEALADPTETGIYPIHLSNRQIDPSPMLAEIVKSLHDSIPLPIISARFHNSLVETAVTICQNLRHQQGINQVVLSGGVWQNMTLLTKTIHALEKQNFTVLFHQKVPTNDGGLALGQIAIAAKTNL